MIKDKNLILAVWQFTINGPRPGRPGRVRVSVSNAEASDLAFARALARLAEMWLNSTRKAGR